MAFDWEHVEAIRAEQNSARNRRDLNTLPTDEVSNEIYNSPSGREAKIPGLDHWEQMIHKVRTQLIDYIIEHGLVQGFEYDGINEPIKNGKIVLTAEMLQRVTDRFGYFKEKETLEFIEKYLPEHHYVADENYVHTDNNFTGAEKAKLEGVADGAEVNKVISVLFNGVESIDPETRVATITITPADVKEWYEQNPDTNVFTDAEKAKLESINLEELLKSVKDVTLDGETIVKDKVAVLTAQKIKNSYESNADTNAFTDADKALVEQVLPEVQKNVNLHEQRIDTLEKSQTTWDAELNDTKKSVSELSAEVNSVVEKVTAVEASQGAQDKRLDALETWKGTTDTTLATLGEKDTAQDGRLDALEQTQTSQGAEVESVKGSVAKLSSDLSTVSGRVTALETSQTAQDGRLEALETWKGTTDTTLTALGDKNTAQDGEISKLKEKDTAQDGEISTLKTKDTAQDKRLEALETWKGTTDTTLTTLGDKSTAQDGEISKLKEKDTAQDGEISTLKTKDTAQDERLEALEASEATQDADIAQLKTDVKNAGKVDDVRYLGKSIVRNKTALIPAADTDTAMKSYINPDEAIISANSTKVFALDFKQIPLNSRITGVLSITIGSANVDQILIGSVVSLAHTSNGDNDIINIKVAVCNPYTTAVEINEITVLFSYI